MDGGPAELSTRHLSLPLVERGELLVVLVEVIKELLEDDLDLLIDPMSVPVLDDEVECVDDREVLEADIVVFQVVKDAANHPDNLLFVGEVENLGDVFEYVELEVLEDGQGEVVIGENPEARADVVGELGLRLTLLLQHAEEDVMATLLHELLS